MESFVLQVAITKNMFNKKNGEKSETVLQRLRFNF